MRIWWLSVGEENILPIKASSRVFLFFHCPVPNHTSELFGQLIESLFITHAECKLNKIGNLVYDNADPNHALRGSWCANLTHRS